MVYPWLRSLLDVNGKHFLPRPEVLYGLNPQILLSMGFSIHGVTLPHTHILSHTDGNANRISEHRQWYVRRLSTCLGPLHIQGLERSWNG